MAVSRMGCFTSDGEKYVVNKKQKTAGKKAQVTLDSDDEVDQTPEEKEAIFGRKKVNDDFRSSFFQKSYLPPG
jgi:hypothetical protein